MANLPLHDVVMGWTLAKMWQQMQKWSDVKKKLKDHPEYLEIRGEVYMKNEDFDRVNEQQNCSVKRFLQIQETAALRNAAPAWYVWQKKRKLSMFVFNIQQVRGMELQHPYRKDMNF